MIELIIELLQISDFYGESERIDIAKGKNKLEYKLTDIYKQGKRKLKWQLKK